ncbi:hypothetical protein IRJ41_018873 [Triplophysa rosa]|uniref:Uncharacterized protein n=1 Tax=Triplophysa rosa TaxID=992332 RepID=A0A9W7T7M2_TRIRA|nr:hypothetical protein IRJ41_018873 [Triplophysa rosa]
MVEAEGDLCELSEADHHPWPQVQSLFSLKDVKKNSLIMRCMLCAPKRTDIAAYKNSSSNLKKYVAVSVKRFQKKRGSDSATVDQPHSKKNPKIMSPFSSPATKVTQAVIDKLLINFVCEGNQPFSIVELPSFRKIIQTLQPQCTVMTRKTLRLKVQDTFKNMKVHVATTADCWSARQRSYMGVTCHWIDKAKSDTYKRLSRSAFAKCSALWNKTSRSVLAFETVERECKLQFLRPNQTRWNSLFLAVERLVRIQKEQGEQAIRNVCTALKIKMLNTAELGFLAEYATVMKPVAMALNLLQGESSVHMGFLLPTLHQLQDKLKRLESTCKVCQPLLKALQGGILKRFGEVMKEPELIAAAILLPKFRTAWTTDQSILTTGLTYIKEQLEISVENDTLCYSSPSDEEDFFASMNTGHSETGELESTCWLSSPGPFAIRPSPNTSAVKRQPRQLGSLSISVYLAVQRGDKGGSHLPLRDGEGDRSTGGEKRCSAADH